MSRHIATNSSESEPRETALGLFLRRYEAAEQESAKARQALYRAEESSQLAKESSSLAKEEGARANLQIDELKRTVNGIDAKSSQTQGEAAAIATVAKDTRIIVDRTRALVGGNRWWLISLLAALLVLIPAAVWVTLDRVEYSEQAVVAKLGDIEKQLQRGVDVNVVTVETPPFVSGSAICAPMPGQLSPCTHLCRFKATATQSHAQDCVPIEEVANAYPDARVVVALGGADGKDLTSSMARSYQNNHNLADTRALVVSDRLEAAWRGRPTATSETHQPTYLRAVRSGPESKADAAGARTVIVTLVNIKDTSR